MVGKTVQPRDAIENTKTGHIEHRILLKASLVKRR